MEAKDLTNEEILKEVEEQAAGEEEKFPWHSEWLKRVKAGTVDHRLLHEAIQKGEKRLWPNLVARFENGLLFGCQPHDFSSMLMMAEEEIDSDVRSWETAKSAAAGAEATKSKVFLEMEAFATTRLAIDFRVRRKFIGEDGSLLPLATFSKETQDSLAQKRERFQEVADRFGWWWVAWQPSERERLKKLYAERSKA